MKIPPTAVIDTSVMVSALLSSQGASAAILDMYLEDRPFLWVMSPFLYDEYLRKAAAKMVEIERKHRQREGSAASMAGQVDAVMHAIAKGAAWMDIDVVHAGITSDPQDDPIGTLAVETGVDYLVTLDGDFAPMQQGGYTVKVVRPGEFLALLRVAR